MTNVLLLTATIVPKAGTPNLSRVDPEQRLNDYLRALSFYLDQARGTFEHIVFCENSNADITKLREFVATKGWTQQVTFYANDGDYPAHYDRGYGEFKLIDEAMATVAALQGRSKVVWKITGRYIISNIGRLVRQTKLPFDLACNYRNYPKLWVDTYLIAWTPDGYERYLKGAYEHLKANVPGHIPGTAAEEMLRTYLDNRKGAVIAKRYPSTPHVRGVRAADNRDYQARFDMKYVIRRTARRVIPWLWL